MAILLARILSGVVANYTSWRNVYWLSLGMQIAVLGLMWCFMADYPPISPRPNKEVVKGYPSLLWSILTLFPRYPILVQSGLLSFLTFFTVASYWTTLTFLLSAPPYSYSTLVIGLFGLIGASTMVLGPLFGKYIVQPLRSPLLSAVVGVTVSLVGIVLGTALGTQSVAGPVLQALLLDAGLMILTISNRMSIHGIEPEAANKVNTAFVSCLYLGMLAGTKAGNDVYEKYNGWLASGGLSIGIIAFSYVVILVRGPHEKGWVGWSGGWGRGERAATENDEEMITEKDLAEKVEDIDLCSKDEFLQQVEAGVVESCVVMNEKREEQT